jgi:hypothetical protein
VRWRWMIVAVIVFLGFIVYVETRPGPQTSGPFLTSTPTP